MSHVSCLMSYGLVTPLTCPLNLLIRLHLPDSQTPAKPTKPAKRQRRTRSDAMLEKDALRSKLMKLARDLYQDRICNFEVHTQLYGTSFENVKVRTYAQRKAVVHFVLVSKALANQGKTTSILLYKVKHVSCLIVSPGKERESFLDMMEKVYEPLDTLVSTPGSGSGSGSGSGQGNESRLVRGGVGFPTPNQLGVAAQPIGSCRPPPPPSPI